MFYDILDTPRLNLLPTLAVLKGRFYLAGGTALALQMGHRDSIDFDFFSEHPFDTVALYGELTSLFSKHGLLKTQEEKNTLSLIIDGTIRMSFFSYPYPLLQPLVEEPYLNLASIEDIACMKLSAITGRAVEKDYVDLYFILRHISLSELLAYSVRKHPSLDTNLVLKSLVYFDDISREPIKFTTGKSVAFEDVQSALKEAVKTMGTIVGGNGTHVKGAVQ